MFNDKLSSLENQLFILYNINKVINLKFAFIGNWKGEIIMARDRFRKSTKEEIFQIWEEFLQQEFHNQYSVFTEYHIYYNQDYVDIMRAFEGFVTNILGCFIGTKKQYCERYHTKWTKELQKKFCVLYSYDAPYAWKKHRQIPGPVMIDVLIEKPVAEIFKRVSNNSYSLNSWIIERNFSDAQKSDRAFPQSY